MKQMIKLIAIFMLLWGFMSTSIWASDIYIGASTVDITPRLPVALMGQFLNFIYESLKILLAHFQPM